MVGDNGYYAPVSYSSAWLWIACGIGALVLLWYLVVWFFPRARAPKQPRESRPAPGELSQRYRRLIDEIEAAHAANEITTREAHLKLSILVRLYVEERSGTRVSALTLADLTESKHAGLADTVAAYYPFEFAPRSSGELAPSVRRARELVM
ncbi:hypothetical protein [Microbacterium sp. MPKO10]|uniref:hypothetical protein n=1 Tax=Microbacterium sp. MPKO10 TaxID=2989818 RepID=UPI002235C6E6|nr:hypothetical protein [Microbacterium sp. MPKO10]MCW4458338.1 hypothetical protein [Microbacterium sp. MPKO10]